MGTMAVKVHFDPYPPASQIRVVARSGDPNCPDCKGKGTIELLTSVVPCTRCARTQLTDGRYRTISYTFETARGVAIDDDDASGYRSSFIS
jgi:hypothetical protein